MGRLEIRNWRLMTQPSPISNLHNVFVKKLSRQGHLFVVPSILGFVGAGGGRAPG
jgi:hypothetical protein